MNTQRYRIRVTFVMEVETEVDLDIEEVAEFLAEHGSHTLDDFVEEQIDYGYIRLPDPNDGELQYITDVDATPVVRTPTLTTDAL